MKRILNLYAGIGGNRKLWDNCHVVAVELNPEIAKIYADLYPNDEVIVGDAHQYLLDHYQEFNDVWSSPPCQSHSQMRQNLAVRFRGTPPVYPDMKLYQEVVFLRHNFKGNWVVENVRPYYTPLIEPTFTLQRHVYWSNKKVKEKKFKTDLLRSAQINDLIKLHGIDISGYRIKDKRQILRNCVAPEIGKYIGNKIFDL